LAIANSDEFGHLPPSQIVPRLADQGRYIASESIFYRLLRAANQLTGLEWSQIDMQNKIAWIHADQSKNGKPIRIPLNDDALLVLRQQIGSHQCRVFTYEGKPIGKVSTKFFRTALIRAGIEGFCWHGLRHTWASWHVQAGTPLNVLQELGGWSDYKMVLRYAHLAPEHLSEYANRLTGIVAKFGCGR
jgi:integrase